MASPFLIIVCVHCDASLVIKKGDLPERCFWCKRPSHWRVAGPDELTTFDLELLRMSRIAAS